jgi:sigma-B regulation protein RsbU (phosphoserine phosphatase)
MDKIMIIDTAELSADLLAKRLTRSGYDVVVARGAQGLATNIKFSRPDLILLDSELGTESGFDVCRRVKSGGARYIPVLMMGASDSPTLTRRSLESGADDYIMKTGEPSAMIVKVRSLLRLKKLSDELKHKYAELEEKNSMLDRQLAMARRVQRSFIREIRLTLGKSEFVSKYMPALDIGGDFFDIVRLGDDVVAVCIGDVSGHGISAALLTLLLNQMIRAQASVYTNPAQFLFHMNNAMVQTFEGADVGMYACMFFAVVDSARRRVYYANAGQVLPIFVDAGAGAAEELDISGTPIGLMPDSAYDYKTLVYNEGDLIMFYTDGLADNYYKDDADEFLNRAKSILLDMAKDASPEVIANSLISAFCAFDGDNRNRFVMDDASLIVCRL